MEVRFVLPSDGGEDPQFDRTVDLPTAPLPGETVGIDPQTKWDPGNGTAWLVEVEHRRWYVNGSGEPMLECWLSDSEGARRRNQYVHTGCRFGFEQMMASHLPAT